MTQIGTEVGSQIERLTRDALKTSQLATPLEPPGYYYMIGPKGEAVLTLAKASWHGEVLECPAELQKFAKRRIEADAMDNPAIFYDQSNIALVYDIDDRRDVANCPLILSQQYQYLWNAKGQLTQSDIVRALRVTFRGCLPDGSILNLLRNLQFTASDAGANNLQHGNESLGRQIISKVQGTEALPEEITLNLPVFENHGFRANVSCALEVFTQARTFTLTPFPQELHRAMELALDDVLIQFSEEGMPPAFRGSYRPE